MEDFFSNPWVTGILGGIISGIIVYFIINFISEKRQNKEYKQKVSSANRDVIYLIRTCIPDGIMPDKVLINMLIDSVARKYSINRADMLNINQIYSDISREIMDSYFIVTEKKMELCNMVINNANSNDTSQDCLTDTNSAKKDQIENEHKQLSKDAKEINLIISMILSISVTFLIVFSKNEIIENLALFDNITSRLFYITSPIIFILTILAVFIVIFKIKENIKKNK